MDYPVTNPDPDRKYPRWGYQLMFCYQCQKRHGPFKMFPDANRALYICPGCGKKQEVENRR